MRNCFFILVFIFLQIPITYAQSIWSCELNGGEVYNLHLPLTIRQQGYPDLKLTARYRSETFTLPIYWDLRFSRWNNYKSWEFEIIHHKLYLYNTTPEVQKFNISHGFNLLMINRGFDKAPFRYHTGAGIALSHPESNIRGKEFGNTGDDLDMGYFISGPVLHLAVSRPIRLGSRFYINSEFKTTLAYSHIKVAEGQAEVYNIAFHFILGLGAEIIKPK